MKITTKHIGSYGGRPAKMIEITVEVNGSKLTEDITDLNHKVDEQFIEDLLTLADELKEHNRLLEITQ